MRRWLHDRFVGHHYRHRFTMDDQSLFVCACKARFSPDKLTWKMADSGVTPYRRCTRRDTFARYVA